MKKTLRIQPVDGLRIQSADKLSRFAAEAMAESGLDEATNHAAIAVAEELFANVLEHSHAEWMEVELVAQDGAARVILRDNGKAFDPTAAIRKMAHGFVLEDQGERNLGLYIVHQLTREIGYLRDAEGRNVVEVEIAPEAPRPAQPAAEA